MFKKIKGRIKKEKYIPKRTVISYEDMPLDDYEQEKTEISPNVIRKIIFAVLGAALLALIVFAFVNREKLTWSNINVWWKYEMMGTKGNGYPLNIVGSEVESGNIAVHQGRIAYASDTSFVTLNSTGGEVCNLQLRHTHPVMKASDNRYLIFGLGETNYQLQTFDDTIFSGSADGSIFAADIAQNGKYCMAVEGNGFYSELYAYDRDNNRVFKYSFAEYYINSVAIKLNGSGCIASGISNNNGEIKTGIYVLDFSKEEPVAKYELGGNYIIDSKFISNNRAVLIGDSASYIYKTDEDVLELVDYGGMPLTNYCFAPSVGTFSLALSKSGDGRSCNLITYDDNGAVRITADTDVGSESLSSYNGMTATLDNNTLYVFDREGNLHYTGNAGAGAKRVLLSSEKEAFILSVNQIRKIDLTRSSTADSAGE